MIRAGWRSHLPDGRTRILGILGDPLDHTLSPRLHTAVLRRLDRNLIYLPFSVSRGRLRAFLRTAAEIGVLGLNVTTPYKEAIARLVPPLDEETARTGVVNTVLFADGGARGTGTDGAGILACLREWDGAVAPFGLFGFGASGRSLAARALAGGDPLEVIVSRRPAEVRRRLRAWGATGVRVESWADFAPFDGRPLPAVWVSTLPPSIRVSPSFWRILPPGSRLLDLNYGEGRTRVADRARAAGIRAAGGLGPLCHQAALSLGLWLGTKVPAEEFLAVLDRSARSLRPAR